MKINIFTDLRFTQTPTPTGVGKHIERMVRGLFEIPGFELSVLAAKDQFPKGMPNPESTLAYLPTRQLPLPWKASDALWSLTGRPYVDSYCRGADWIYCPKNDYIPVKKSKLAITIHGFQEFDPEVSFTRGLRYGINRFHRRAAYKRIVDRADLILTVSYFLKDKITEVFSADPKKIVVVGNGVEELYFSGISRQNCFIDRNLKPYLLCVGGLNKTDGGAEIISTASFLLSQNIDLEFWVAGWQHEQQYLTMAKQLPNVKLLGYVPSSKLAVLMKNAVGLFYLTHYETFGIAAAEAMASGIPVITAGGTAVPEIVGDAGLYVTREIESIVEGIKNLLYDSTLADSLSRKGVNRAKAYTWSSCVDRLVKEIKKKC